MDTPGGDFGEQTVPVAARLGDAMETFDLP
ncbi:hypothetical protein M2428_001050 [Arthrobacter sp. ES3-54]|jgi:hypothetical protein|nr:hypothetical protein [Arthrobacter sp. ES3-54]